MDLSRCLAAVSTRRVSVLVVEAPGWELVRCAVQREVRTRGWRSAQTPADADALVLCGRPERDLARPVELVWRQLPGPRARITVTAPTAAGPALDQVLADLLDEGRRRDDARGRARDTTDDSADGEPAGDGHGDGDGDGDGGMDMPMPGGIPLAGEGPDRDGLDLDELHVPLGPVLPAWPAGLVVDCTLQGDLVTAAGARVLAGGTPPPGCGLVHGSPADRLDRAARLLEVAGWESPALTATELRDRLLFAGATDDVPREVARLAGRVRRSRVLRWALADVPGVREQLLDWLEGARDGLAGRPAPVAATAPESLGASLVGRDLAAVRLLAAAADLDPAGLLRGGADLS